MSLCLDDSATTVCTVLQNAAFLERMNGRCLEGETYVRPLADLQIEEGAFGDQRFERDAFDCDAHLVIKPLIRHVRHRASEGVSHAG